MFAVVVRALVAALAVASLMIAGGGPTFADTTCQVTDPETGKCLIWIETNPGSSDPGNGDNATPSDSGQGQACYWDPSKQGVVGPPAGPVACTSDAGYWSNAHNCYIQAADPQPPGGDPAWRGHEPGDGAVYQCYQPQTGILIYLWSQDPPPNSGAGPTPREVAQLAIDEMELRAINVGITPEPGAGSVGIVGMPVWLWAANPDTHTVGPISAAASAGGITVTATARLHRITWDMGDGTTVTCNGTGTPYKASYGNKKSPDCGHVYKDSSSTKSSGMFKVTATSDWVITWQGAGQTGTIRLNGLSRSVDISIGEAQVLVQ